VTKPAARVEKLVLKGFGPSSGRTECCVVVDGAQRGEPLDESPVVTDAGRACFR